VPITITITANNAAEAKQLVHDLAYAIFRLPPEQITDAEVSTVEEVASDSPAPTFSTAGAPEVFQVKTVSGSPNSTTVVPGSPVNSTAAAPQPQSPEPAGDLFGDEPIPTDVELREIARKISTTPERKAAVKELLAKYGVPNITAVPNEKRIAFKRDLEAMAL